MTNDPSESLTHLVRGGDPVGRLGSRSYSALRSPARKYFGRTLPQGAKRLSDKDPSSNQR
jgi:hypothetical protein